MQLLDIEDITLLVYSPEKVPKEVMRAITARHERLRIWGWFALLLLAIMVMAATPLTSDELLKGMVDAPVYVTVVALVLAIVAIIFMIVARRRAVANKEYRRLMVAGKYRQQGLVRSVDHSYQIVVRSKYTRPWLEGKYEISSKEESRITDFFSDERGAVCDEVIHGGLRLPPEIADKELRYLQRVSVFTLYFEAHDYLLSFARAMFKDTALEDDTHLQALGAEVAKELKGLYDDLRTEVAMLEMVGKRLSFLR